MSSGPIRVSATFFQVTKHPRPGFPHTFDFLKAAFDRGVVRARGRDLTEAKNYLPDILPSLVSEN
jgi:hypothetical protein